MLMTKRRVIALGVVIVGLIALLGVTLALAGGHDAPAAANPPAATARSSASPAPAATTPAADPYAVYLAHNPRPDLVLSREDAQTRALLGCGQTFAPGTVDAVLAAAYRPTGLCSSHG